MVSRKNGLFCGAALVLAAGYLGCSSTPDSTPGSRAPGHPTAKAPDLAIGILPSARSAQATAVNAIVRHNAAPLGNSRVQVTATPVQRTIVTDPDHDSIWLMSAGGSPAQRIELGIGEEPGDIALASNTAYVSLHNGGAIVSVPLTSDTSSAPSYSRIPVCQSPRGMDVFGGTLFVACADGVLVEVDVATNTVLTTIPLLDDLKDVVVMDSVDALVTRFRTAEVLVVNLNTGKYLTASLQSFSPIPLAGPNAFAGADAGTAPMTPEVAWQMIPVNNRQGALIVHQLASTDVINVSPMATPPADPPCQGCFDAGSEPIDSGPPPRVDGDGGFGEGADGGSDMFDSGFGEIDGGFIDGTDGGFISPPACGGGGQQGYGPSQCGPSPTCGAGVVAAAGTLVTLPADDQAPVVTPLFAAALIPPLTAVEQQQNGGDDMALIAGIGNGATVTIDLTSQGFTQTQANTTYGCAFPAGSTLPTGTAALGLSSSAGTAAAFVLQQGSSAAFVTQIDAIKGVQEDTAGVSLPYEPIYGEDGRNLFHQATPSMMSCASCHPNGRDDGHTWNFNPMGLRRTPALGGGLLATAPFHWDGSEADISHLMNDVFVGRMEGSAPTSDQVTAISGWLDGLPEAHAVAAPDAAAVARGKALFESAGVQCTACHSGEHFTNNLTMDVGTGGSFQVPSLLGVGSRPPYLHDGRAATLEDRFDPSRGGGDQHGHTSQLTSAQVEDLVAYLRSL